MGDVLDAEGIELGDHDQVAPGLDQAVTDGTKISVRFGRPLELNVDGDEQTYWVTATNVDRRPAADRPGLHRRRALGQPRRRHRPRWALPSTWRPPRRSPSRSAPPRRKTKTVAALDVRDLLDQLDVERRQGRPGQAGPRRHHRRRRQGRGHPHQDGHQARQARGRRATSTVEQSDDSMDKGTTSVVRAGEDGLRDVTYRAHLPQRPPGRPQGAAPAGARASPSTRSSRSAPARSRPRTSPAATPSGTPSRSASPAATGPPTPATATTAACSSRSAPGRRTAAAGCPASASRETQIAIATKVRDASGGYGAWPACARPAWACLARLSSHAHRRSETPRAGGGPSLAAELDLRPTKQRGQNFVIDANTVRRIVRESGVGPDDVVLEVGPGLGSLTLALLEVGARVVAVEIDERLATRLPVDRRRARARSALDRLESSRPTRCASPSVPGPPPTALVANLPVQRLGARCCCTCSRCCPRSSAGW